MVGYLNIKNRDSQWFVIKKVPVFRGGVNGFDG